MQSRSFQVVNDMLRARALPTATLFLQLVVGYYTATLVASVALGSLVDSHAGSSWVFFNHSVAIGRSIPAWCALWVWTKCFVRRPDRRALTLARCGLVLGAIVYAIKCFWLVGALGSDSAQSAPTVTFLLLETVFAMSLMTVTIVIGRFQRVSSSTWIWFDLLLLSIGVALVVATALRGLDVLDKASVAVGIVASAVVLGHKLARWTCTYAETLQLTVAAQLHNAADDAPRRS